MKPLKLTKEHEVKFLEMCNTLFPERRNIVLTKHNTIRFDYKIISGGESWSSDKSIHWFEFCMTHLVVKLNNIKFNNNDVTFIFWKDLAIRRTHIVDYLYNEFKKLNNENKITIKVNG